MRSASVMVATACALASAAIACGGGDSDEVGTEEWAFAQIVPTYEQMIDEVIDENWNEVYDLWTDVPDECSRTEFVAERAFEFEQARELLGEEGYQEFQDSLIKESEDEVEEGFTEFQSATDEEIIWIDEDGNRRSAVKTSDGWRFTGDICELFAGDE